MGLVWMLPFLLYLVLASWWVLHNGGPSQPFTQLVAKEQPMVPLLPFECRLKSTCNSGTSACSCSGYSGVQHHSRGNRSTSSSICIGYFNATSATHVMLCANHVAAIAPVLPHVVATLVHYANHVELYVKGTSRSSCSGSFWCPGIDV